VFIVGGGDTGEEGVASGVDIDCIVCDDCGHSRGFKV